MKPNSGLTRAARYSFAPNHFHYCGPERQNDLQSYVSLHQSDRGLQGILSEFDTLYKYLALIAYENNIRDPFDSKVVEAYWLGNSLLKKTKYQPLFKLLTDSLALKKKLTTSELQKTLATLDAAVAHHTFHVLNVFKRTGHLPIRHTLETMDACRINWGRVINQISHLRQGFGGQAKINPPAGGQNDNAKFKNYLVEITPLVLVKSKLTLGKPEIREVISIGLTPKIGDWVSVHWGYVCEVLTKQQLANLKYFTELAIQLANRSHVIPSETK